jgi:aromatic ring-opening dioxygenase catalytic subunit (LigB family)
MAEIVGALYTSNGPFTNLPADEWGKISKRSYRADIEVEAPAEREEKAERLRAGLAVLRRKFDDWQPDTLVIFGNDQAEIFDFTNFPALAVFVGHQFSGQYSSSRLAGAEELIRSEGRGEPVLASHILTSLLRKGFDPAFSMEQPPGRHMCHSVMHPLEYFDAWHVPTVPVLINGYYAPQETAERACAIGRAVGQAIDEFPGEQRIVLIGSGGLWHTPRREESYLDEAFDREFLARLEKGDASAMAEHFDQYVIAAEDKSQLITADIKGMTGMSAISGPQMGTREMGNWVATAAAMDGVQNIVVDYVPVYASPIGIAFAHSV